jgi:uncharacterized protein (TIGR02391 family)
VFFDDLHILRTIDRCEREGLTGALSDGLHLLQEVLASPHPIHDIDACTSFIKELELAERDGLLTCTVMQTGGNVAQPSISSMGANNYLGYLRDFQLTPRGHDRALCRVYEREPPDPGEDDGKPITRLTFERISEMVAAAYDEPHLRLFLRDGGIPEEMIPQLGQNGAGLVDLFALFNGGASNDRRILRHFVGRWLAQELDSGPDADQERALLADLGRQGWFVRNDTLVRGEPIRRATVAPLLGGDLLSNFHPAIQEAARPSFGVGRRAEAVFEAFKAIELRVGALIGSEQTGMSLMGDAFGGDAPRLKLNDLTTRPERDEQEGFTFIFKGAVQGVRNPKAHGRFEELEDRRALDYLGLASLLMRRLDDAEARLRSTAAKHSAPLIET